ncbi:MAG TPA: pitrilysin family protein [Candidatus Acidoferrales bacterium]|nr:pitrilysin family protein [Candidatus Acidoferrales bacterium]
MRTLLALALLSSMTLTGPAFSEIRPAPQRTVMDNGVVLLTAEQRGLPMVTLKFLLDAGSRHDPAGHEGLACLTARLLTYGTRTRTATQIAEALDFIGASLNTGCDQETASVTLTTLRKDLSAGLNLLADVLINASFPPDEIDRQKQAVIAAIRAKAEKPGEIANKKFAEALFPQSAYGRQPEGSEESVKKIARSDLVEFHGNFYRPNRAILAVVGDISHREALKRLTKAFQGWEKGTPPKDAFTPPKAGGPETIRVHKSLTQANIVLGHEGVPRGHPDYYAIQVMNYILGGGGFSSRLMEEIRNQRGLAYSVYSQFDAAKLAGSFQIVMQTKNETASEAIRIAKEEIQRIREKGVTDEELKAAKDYLIGSFPLRLDTNRRIAAFLAQVEFFELGLDYPERYPEFIRRVTRADVARVAKRYLLPNKLITVIVSDQERSDGKK